MSERIVYWRALADFSKVRSEAKKTQKSIHDLNRETDSLNASNERLGHSEDQLAAKTKKSGDAVDKSTKKKKTAVDALNKSTKASTKSTIADTLAAARANTQSKLTIKQKDAEIKAQKDVLAATDRLKIARDAAERKARDVTKAESDLERAQKSGSMTMKQMIAAENALQKARNDEARATDKVKAAAVSLQTARQRESTVTKENAFQNAKASEEFIKQEAAKAKAAEDAQRRQQAATERQDRMDARFDKMAQARKDSADRREATQSAKQKERDDRKFNETVRRNQKLYAEYDKLQAAQAAAANAERHTYQPGSTPGPLQDRIDAVRAGTDKLPKRKETNQLTSANNTLTRSETLLKAAHDAEAASYTRLNAAEEKLAVARANSASAAAQAISAEHDFRDAKIQSGEGSLHAAEAEARATAAKTEHLRATNLERDAEVGLTRAKNGTVQAADRVKASEDRLTAATHNAERALTGAGGGGNIFSRSLNTLNGWFNKADSAFSSFVHGLAGIKWPALAGGVYLLVTAVSALVSGLFALGSAVAPAIGGLAAAIPVAYALGGAFLGVFAAFKGVGSVLKAYGQAQLKASTGGAKAANAAQSNADAIVAAQQQIKDAREQVGITAAAGAQSVADAAKTIVDATRNERDAQLALNDARVAAKKNIIDLKNAVVDAALAERGATLDLADARANLQHVLNDPNSSRADRERAQLQVDSAVQGQKSAAVASSAAKAASTTATTNGVSGDSGVIAAKRQLVDATAAVTKAERDYNKTVIQTARDNRKAIEAVANAQRSLGKAQRSASVDTSAAATAMDTYKAKLAALNPATRAFVLKLISMKKYWSDLKSTAAANLFPGLTKGLDALKPVFPVITQGIGMISREVGNLGLAFANMLATPRWISAFKQLNTASVPILHNLGGAFMNIIDALRAIAVAAIPLAKKLTAGFDAWTKSIDRAANAGQKSGRMTKFFEHSYKVIHTLGQILKNLGKIFFGLGKSAMGAGTSMLNSIDALTAKWAAWVNSVKGQTTLTKYFNDVRENLRIIDKFIGNVALSFFKLGASKSFSPIIQGLKDIWSAIKTAFGSQGNSVSQVFVGLLHTIADTIRAISKNSDGLKVFLGVLKTMLTLFNGFIQLPGMGPLLGTIFAGFAAFKALKLLGVISMIEGLGTAIGKFVKNSKGIGAATAATNTALAGSAAVGGAPAARAGTTAAAAAAATVAATPVPMGGRRAPLAIAGAPARTAEGKLYAETRPVAQRAAQGGGKAAAAAGGAAAAGASGGLIGGVKKGAAVLKDFFSGASKYGKGGPWAVAIAAVVTALVIAYNKWKWFHDAVNSLFRAIGDVAMKVWNNGIKPFVMGIVNFVKSHSDGFKALFGALGNLVKAVVGVFQSAWPAVAAVFKVVWAIAKPILIVLGAALYGLLQVVGFVFKGIVLALNIAAKILAAVINGVIIPVINAIMPVLHALWTGISAVWNAIVSVFRVAAKIIWAILSVAFKVIAAVILAPIAALIWLFQKIWDKIGGAIKFTWNAVTAFLKSVWTGIASIASIVWNTVKDAIMAPINLIWSGIKGVWNTVFGWLKGIWNDIASSAGGPFHKIAKTISDIMNGISGTISNIWDGIKNIFASAINFVTQDILNPLIHAINWVITKFGMKEIHDIPAIGGAKAAHSGGKSQPGANNPKNYAKGGVTDIGNMVPGYTPGRDPHEFVSNTGYKVRLSGGEGILTPETTRALGGKRGIDSLNRMHTARLPGGRTSKNSSAFKGGGAVTLPDGSRIIGDPAMDSTDPVFLQDGRLIPNPNYGRVINTGATDPLLEGPIGRVVSAGFNKLRSLAAWASKKALQAAETPIRALINRVPIKTFRDMTNGIFDKANNGIYNWIKGKQREQKAKAGNNGGYGMGHADTTGHAPPVGDHIALIKQALGLARVPDDTTTEEAVNIIASYESGWNPNAINLTDSNAQAGHPSQGLMQTIPSTFEAYRLGSLPDDITNPLSNMVAGIRYANSTYGSVNNVPGVKAVRRGDSYVGYHDGGIIQNFHSGGVVGNLNRGSRNKGIAALTAQAGIGFSSGAYPWTTALTNQYRQRLAGVDKSHDVSHTGTNPKVESPLSFDSYQTRALMNWVDAKHPSSYAAMWSRNPDLVPSEPNKYKRNPLLPILSYIGSPKGWGDFRKNKDAQTWATLAAQDNKAGKTKKNTPATEMKKHPGTAAWMKKQDTAWAKQVKMLYWATQNEKVNVATLRKNLGMGGTGNNQGLFSSDMQMPMDHAAAHSLGIQHPADWAHPWSGPVTATESALADSDRANALNKEWFADLSTIATWGYEDLVQYLLDKGVADGMSIARSAIKDKKTAQQLNDSIRAGKLSAGVNGDDQTQILKIIAKLGSGTTARPFGLRDVAADLNVSDYVPVNLFDKMSDQLKKLPASLTKKFIADVGAFRQGTFYAARGGVVPGDQGSPNVDSQPAMLVPGEGVLNRKAMSLMGADTFNALNQGYKPQAFSGGGLMLSPTFANLSVGDATLRTPNARGIMTNGNGASVPPVVNINTEINNPTGESSVYSQNKMLQRNAVLGTVAKVAGR